MKVFCDQGFKKTFLAHCADRHLSAEVVSLYRHVHAFEVLPRRWVVERTWSWLMNHRRLQVDYERDPKVTEGFVMGRPCPAPAPSADRTATWLNAREEIGRTGSQYSLIRITPDSSIVATS